MIQKLRLRFILLSMSTLLVVLVVLVGGINVANYSGFVSEADRILPDEKTRTEYLLNSHRMPIITSDSSP